MLSSRIFIVLPVICQSIIHLEVTFLWILGGEDQDYFINGSLTEFNLLK